MPPRKAAENVKRNIARFRLFMGDLILRYCVDTFGSHTDMQHEHAVLELCDQYSLRVLTNWIATKYGFPAYTSEIEPGSSAALQVLEDYAFLTQAYPLYTDLSSTKKKRNEGPAEEVVTKVAEAKLWKTGFDFLDKTFEPDLFLIGMMYEHTLAAPLALVDGKLTYPRAKTKRAQASNEFYTPRWVVDYCVAQSLANGARPKSIFDPACGTGNFLLGFAQLHQLDREFHNSSRKPSQLDREFHNSFNQSDREFHNSRIMKLAIPIAELPIAELPMAELPIAELHGCDVDGRAVSLCRLVLLIALCGKRNGVGRDVEATWKQLRKNIRVADSTVEAPDRQFDLVVGNPPYVSFGSRNQKALPANWSVYLRKSFPSAAEYKIRLHSIFQEIAINCAKENGQIILLVPDAFLNGAYYQKLRKLLIDKTQIQSLAELPERTFNDATVGNWCVAHYVRKPAASKENAVELFRFDSAEQPPTRFRIDTEDLVSADKYRFQLFFNDADCAVFRKVKTLKPLQSELRGHTGIRSRIGQAAIVANGTAGAHRANIADHATNKTTWRRGLISGAELLQHKIAWAGNFINIDAKQLFAGGHDRKIIKAPKILVRQTADRLIAALDLDSFYHLNNIHSFAPTAPAPLPKLLFWTELLNSDFWFYLYALKSREFGRALAQIDIEMIESMPLPGEHPTLVETVARLSQLRTADLEKHGVDDEGISAAVNAHIYTMYDLTSAEILHIENTLNALKPSRNAVSRGSAASAGSSEQISKLLKLLQEPSLIATYQGIAKG